MTNERNGMRVYSTRADSIQGSLERIIRARKKELEGATEVVIGKHTKVRSMLPWLIKSAVEQPKISDEQWKIWAERWARSLVLENALLARDLTIVLPDLRGVKNPEDMIYQINKMAGVGQGHLQILKDTPGIFTDLPSGNFFSKAKDTAEAANNRRLSIQMAKFLMERTAVVVPMFAAGIATAQAAGPIAKEIAANKKILILASKKQESLGESAQAQVDKFSAAQIEVNNGPAKITKKLSELSGAYDLDTRSQVSQLNHFLQVSNELSKEQQDVAEQMAALPVALAMFQYALSSRASGDQIFRPLQAANATQRVQLITVAEAVSVSSAGVLGVEGNGVVLASTLLIEEAAARRRDLYDFLNQQFIDLPTILSKPMIDLPKTGEGTYGDPNPQPKE